MSYLVGQGFSQRLARARCWSVSVSVLPHPRGGGAKTLRDYGPVRQWMNDFAAAHRRWGYKRAWARAKSEGIVVGRDTFRRLWRTEGLRVRVLNDMHAHGLGEATLGVGHPYRTALRHSPPEPAPPSGSDRLSQPWPRECARVAPAGAERLGLGA